VNSHFRTAISTTDVIWAFAGVRSLYGDGSDKPQDVPRDYELVLDARLREAPLLTVYGGKITTYRRLAEAALDKLAKFFGERAPWTAASHLPGGDFPADGVEALVARTRDTWPFMTEGHVSRLVAAYGTAVARVLGAARSLDDLGPQLGADLTGAEVRYLMAYEWAQTEDDVLWRRSKLGLRLTRDEAARLGRFMAGEIGNQEK
jgi:glycerol-3-phosphate dehydrogenase